MMQLAELGRGRLMKAIAFLVTALTATCLVAVEVEEFWYRADEQVLRKLRLSLDRTNSVEMVLIWTDETGVLWERNLLQSEVRQVAPIANQFETVTREKGTYREKSLKALRIRSSREPRTTVELRVSESDQAFASFHEDNLHDTRKLRFRAPGMYRIFLELAAQPGARKKKVPEISLPKGRTNQSN